MSQLVFGKSYHLLESPDNHWIADAILGQMRRVSFLMQLPELEDMRLHKLLFPNARKKALRFSMKSREIMEKRKESSEEITNDLFSKLLAAKDPETGESLSQLQLWAESNLLIIAGKCHGHALLTVAEGFARLRHFFHRNGCALFLSLSISGDV